jgi:putative nucleotidyltransferase with HDIG domain
VLGVGTGRGSVAEEPITDIKVRRLLIAHGDTEDREFLTQFLGTVGGYEVMEAVDGVGLIKGLKARPDLILMDAGPKGNFLRALEIIRRTAALKNTPVAIYSHDQTRLSECVSKGADGFIMKPCSPAVVLGKVWKLLGLDSPQDVAAASFASRYRRDLDKIDNLPTLPTVYAEVDKLCQNPDVSADELSRAIENDPSITLKLLNLANSAFFGFTRKIKSIKDAISLLGNQTVKNTILNIAIYEATKDLGDSAGLDKNQFWLHSAGVGSVARTLSAKLGLEREEAFTAGIVHDMGKILLDSMYKDFYLEVLERAQSESISLYEAEVTVIGLEHGQIGRELAESWGLPAELIEAVACHHRPMRSEKDVQIASLVHVSDAVARKLGVGSGGDSTVPEPASFALDRLGLSAEKLEELEPEIQEAVDRDKAFLAVIKS